LSSSTSSVNEGDDFVITLTTTNVPSGAKVSYTLVPGEDLGMADPTGVFTIGADQTASVIFRVIADNLTEGQETFTLQLTDSDRHGNEWQNKSISVTINDTSIDPTPTPEIENSCCEDGFKTVITTGLVNGSPNPQVYTHSTPGLSDVDLLSWTFIPAGKLCFDVTPTGDEYDINAMESQQRVYLSDDVDTQIGVFTKMIQNTENTIYFTTSDDKCYMGIWNPDNDNLVLTLQINAPTPTPTPDIVIPPQPTCCSDDKEKTTLTNGDAESVNQVSLNGNVDGTLCWEHINVGGPPGLPYIVSLVNFGTEQGRLVITIAGTLTSTNFRFNTSSGDCYEGQLLNHAEANIFSKI